MKHLKFSLAVAFFLILAGLFLLFKHDNANQNATFSDKSVSEGQVAGASSTDDTNYAARLAKALKDSGAVLYCSKDTADCKKQLSLFDDNSKYLDYVECDAKQADANAEECSANQISVYPTWIYQGQKTIGVQELAVLAEMIHLNDK